MSGGSLSVAAEDDNHLHELGMAGGGAEAANVISIQDRKDQALLALKSDIMAKLNKELKSLDDDSWMFDGPRSCIHLISGPGGLRHSRTKISTPRDKAPQM